MRRLILFVSLVSLAACDSFAERLTGTRPPGITCPDTFHVTPGVPFKIPLACTTLYKGQH